MVSESSSRVAEIDEPTALTCVPGASQARSTIGSRAEVAVTTTSASRSASSALAAASTGNGASDSATSASTASGVRLHTRARSNRPSAAIASRCERACTPAPRIASSFASGLARARVATAETAAVRMAVTAEPSSTARSWPVSPSKSSTPPWWASRPFAGFPGKMQTAFRPYEVPGSERCAGIRPNRLSSSGGRMAQRSGCHIRPRAKSESVSCMSSMQSPIGSSRRTSSWERTSSSVI